jgi:sec-independent protein translocase protein TatC
MDTLHPERALPPRVEEEEPGARMSFFEHLVELRKRLINSLLAIGLGMVLGLSVSSRVISFVVQPMIIALRAHHLEDRLYYPSPATPITLYINLGFYIGIVIAMPFVLYQIWLFVAPGLYRHERRAVVGFVASSMFLFLCGMAFGYYIMLPQVLNFLIGFANHLPLKPLISINEYFDFILIVLVGLGVIFELPVLIFILSLFGIVTPKFLIFMAPMVLLYFVGVLVSYMVLRRKRARDLAAGEAH